MKLRIPNIMLVIIAVAVLAAFAFSVEMEPKPDSVVVLKTLGMTCSSCSERIDKVLHAQQGVASTEVDVAAGRVTVWYDSKQAAAERLAQVVTGSGYGSSILVKLSADDYRAATGRSGTTMAAAGGSGCGGGCCAGK